jgi:hypothetical protein
MIANNLLKEIYKLEEDPKLVKIITCNKKYAVEIKDYVGKLSVSLGKTMEHLVKHEDRLRFKAEQEFQRSSPEIIRVLSTSKIEARSLSGIRLAVTPTGFTPSDSTPKEARESIQEKPKPRPDFLPKDIQEITKKTEEEVCQVDMEVDAITIEEAKVEEEPHVVSEKTSLEDYEDRIAYLESGTFCYLEPEFCEWPIGNPEDDSTRNF